MVQPAVSASTFLSKSADKLLLQMLIPSAAWRQYDSHSSYAHMKRACGPKCSKTQQSFTQ